MDDQGPLSVRFLAALPEPLRAGASTSGLEALLAGRLTAARAAFPGVALPDDAFVARLAEGCADGGALSTLKTDELYLACAAARGNTAAIALLEARYFGDALTALRRMNLGNAKTEDVLQTIRRRLFVAEGPTRPKILEYGGRGELRGWLRVTAVRDALKALRGREREVLVEDERLLELPQAVGDVELERMKALYRPAFQQAFRDAFTALPAREKNLLRQSVLDGLSIDDLALLYHAHRATCARWLEAARGTLFTETRRRLMERVGIDEAECESIIRLVQSQLHVTLRRLFDA
jgi:RNA polymerase sigma-70 factor (ECF subfamily)